HRCEVASRADPRAPRRRTGPRPQRPLVRDGAPHALQRGGGGRCRAAGGCGADLPDPHQPPGFPPGADNPSTRRHPTGIRWTGGGPQLRAAHPRERENRVQGQRQMPIKLDYNNMLRPRLGDGRGIDPERLGALAERFRRIHADVEARRDGGDLGFYQLPYASEVVDAIEQFAEGPGQAFSNLVVLGIGGSALGTVALRTALLDPFWNELDDE